MSMLQQPLASRLAGRLWGWALGIAALAAAMTAANLGSLVSDGFAIRATLGIGTLAAATFLCATFDRRFQNGVSAINAERRSRPKGRAFQSFSLPGREDLPLMLTSFVLLAECVISGALSHKEAAALSFATFFFLTTIRTALAVRHYPTDQFRGAL